MHNTDLTRTTDPKYETDLTNKRYVDNEIKEVINGKFGQEVIKKNTDAMLTNVVSKNIFNGLLELGNYNADGTKTTSDGIYRNVNMIPIEADTQYMFSINGIGQNYVVLFYDKNNVFINTIATVNYAVRSPKNAAYMNFRCYIADFVSNFKELKIQIEASNEITSYTPYLNLQELEEKLGKKEGENLIIEKYLKYGTNYVSYGSYENGVRNGIALSPGKYTFKLEQNYYLSNSAAYQIYIVNSSGSELTHYTNLHFQVREFEIPKSEYHYVYIHINTGDAKYCKLTLYENV